MKNKLLISLIFTLFIIPHVLAWTETTFNNSLSDENLTFTNQQNITRYLKIPNTVVNLTRAYLNITGYIINPNTNGLICYWDMNSTSGNVTDLKDGDSNVTAFFGSITRGVGGIKNNAIKINNLTSFMTTEQYGDFITAQRGAISIWFNWSGGVTSNYMIEAYNTSGTNYYPEFYITLDNSSTNGRISAALTKQTGAGNTVWAVNSQNRLLDNVSINTWHNLVVIQNGTGIEFYLDGVKTSSVYTSSLNKSAWLGYLYGIWTGNDTYPNIITIGAKQRNGVGNGFSGALDEIAFWDKELSSSEVALIYNNGNGNDILNVGKALNLSIGGESLELDISGNGTIKGTMRTNNIKSMINKMLNSTYLIGSDYLVPFVFRSYENSTLEYNELKFEDTAQYNFTNNLQPSCSVLFGTISSDYLYTPMNSSTETITCTLEGYDDYTETYNPSEGDKNFTMTSRELKLDFRYYNGSYFKTNGYWTDGTETGNFSTNNLTLAVANLSQGVTKIYFGYNESVMNYTQFYEFQNDWITSVRENMTMITGSSNKVYIKVVDISGNPVNDALVKIAFSNILTGGAYKEMGQRFTGGYGVNGLTSFYIDPSSDVSIRITKDGYTAKTILDNIRQDEYGSTNPLTVLLERGENEVYHGISLVTQQTYDTNDSTISVFVYAPSRSSISFTTTYNPTQNWTIDLDEFKQGVFTLQRGTHYCLDCSNDFNITLFSGSNKYNEYKIINKARDNVKFTTPSDMDKGFKLKLAWILMLFSVGILSILFKGSEEGAGMGSRGKTLFLIGCGILPIVMVGEFVFLIVILSFYIVGIIIKRWISE